MKKFLTYLPVVVFFMAAMVLTRFAVYATETEWDTDYNIGNKVEFCHAKGPGLGTHDDPYNHLNVNINALFNSGHDVHDGPVWYKGIVGEWGDIIPPFSYQKKINGVSNTFHFAGKNWNQVGMAVWGHGEGCEIPLGECLATIDADPIVEGEWSDWIEAGTPYREKEIIAHLDYFDRETPCYTFGYYYECEVEVPVLEKIWSDWAVSDQDETKETREAVATVDSTDSEIACTTETETIDIEVDEEDPKEDPKDEPKDEEPTTTPTVTPKPGEVLGTDDEEVVEEKEEEKGEVLSASTVALTETSGGNSSNVFVMQAILLLSLVSALWSYFEKSNVLSILKKRL